MKVQCVSLRKKKMARKILSPHYSSSSGRCLKVWTWVHGDSSFHEFYCLLVGEIFCKILSSPFPSPAHSYHFTAVFSPNMPSCDSHTKARKWLIWTATTQQIPSWLDGRFLLGFFWKKFINNALKQCPCSIFSSMHPEVVPLTKSHRKTQSPCVLLEFGGFPKFASSFVGVW